MSAAVMCASVSKRYGLATVVNDVSLTIKEGTVHSIVGANGAGKSTLLGILSGRTPADSGTVSVFDHELRGGSPAEARRAGLAAVYQELTVLPALSLTENVFLGQPITTGGWLRRRAMKQQFRELCRDFGVEFDPKQQARNLTVANAQIIEILRAIQSGSRVLLFDEPTAALSERERRHFLDLIGELKRRGITMVLVTHNLTEVLEVSDYITVMTNGRKTAEGTVQNWSRRALVEAMTGVPEGEWQELRGKDIREVALEARGVSLPGAIEDVALTVRRGEVVGLAGLVGSGRTSLLRCLAGAESRSSGQIFMGGRASRWPRRVRTALKLGIGLIPEERKTDGLLLRMSVPDNVTLASLGSVGKFGFVSRRRQFAEAKTLLTRLALSREVGNYPVGWLSGGNQQKVAVAKWLHRDPEVLLVDEPTRGIDVGAKADVLQALRRTADEGKAVVMTSSEIEEVLAICDRVIVMRDGRAVAEMDLHTSSPTTGDILHVAFGLEGTP
ncbi:sugar ABC transporter ATP-binding protein [Microbacterium sp. NPDC058389]|uniref:sugar ABC transporter ATP-binding protein n=1 Tax=Microbacterium sp. NPDC058389 TaxID=3346475 RepID=UPI00366963CC